MFPRVILACLVLLSAPYWALYAQAASGGSIPSWAERIDGFRLADTVRGELRTSGDGEEASLVVGGATVSKARAAYSAEPLATDALFVAALASDESGPTILSAAREIDKRNSLIGLSLLQMEAQRNATEGVLALVDQLTRVRPQLAPQFVSVLSKSLAEENSLPLLEQALATNPAWAASFWRKVPKESASLTHFVNLREKISPPADLTSERSLLQALIGFERFEKAFELHTEFQKRNDTGLSYPPLDWQLTQTRDVQARQTSGSNYALFIQRDTAGKIAEKLVQLEPGEFRLLGELSTRQGEAKLSAELRCATNNGNQTWPARAEFSSARWSISRGSCQYAWLTVSGSAWNSSLNFDGTIKGLDFEKK